MSLSQGAGASGEPSLNDRILFWASFLTLIAAGIGFSVRGTSVLAAWGRDFGFTQTELGTITGGGLAGFGVAIIVLSFFADAIGYGKLMLLAFLLHASSAVVTLSAGYVYTSTGGNRDAVYNCLNIGMWLFALGNGACEAVINPLVATLFPKEKTHRLNILHAGWPVGLILGAGLGQVFSAIGDVSWQVQIGTFLIPTMLYGVLMFGRTFPKSETNSSGVPMGEMVLTLLRPLLLFLFLIHAMVGYVELGTDSWITNITNKILESPEKATWLFIWTSGLMAVLRFFAGPIVHRISPLGLLLASAILGALGLYMLSSAEGVMAAILAATIYGLGKTFFWPTMLGVVSEQYPKGGALALGFCGGIGMLSAGLLGGPGIGYKQDYFAKEYLEKQAEATYARYKAAEPKGFLTFEKIQGIDNAKVGVLNDDAKTLTSDMEILKKENRENKDLAGLSSWWQNYGEPNKTTDKDPVTKAQLHGARQALLYTAAVPATMAVCYLILLLYFLATGGYKQEHI